MAEDYTHGERVEYLRLLVEEARAVERRGLVGTLSQEYAELHETMNAELAVLVGH